MYAWLWAWPGFELSSLRTRWNSSSPLRTTSPILHSNIILFGSSWSIYPGMHRGRNPVFFHNVFARCNVYSSVPIHKPHILLRSNATRTCPSQLVSPPIAHIFPNSLFCYPSLWRSTWLPEQLNEMSIALRMVCLHSPTAQYVRRYRTAPLLWRACWLFCSLLYCSTLQHGKLTYCWCGFAWCFLLLFFLFPHDSIARCPAAARLLRCHRPMSSGVSLKWRKRR